MNTISTKQLQAALTCAARRIIEAEPYLTEMDTIIGDGDHGTSMKGGFSALEQQLAKQEYASPYDLLHASGLCLVRSMGGASGVLFGTLFIGGLDQLKGAAEAGISLCTHLDDVEGSTSRPLVSLSAGALVAFWSGSVDAIQRRGRTGPGDKTMVDALVPAAKAMQAELQKGGGIPAILKAAYLAALEGVENTRTMMPRAGRSKNFREKAIGHPDPGAISVSIILQGLYEGIQREERSND